MTRIESEKRKTLVGGKTPISTIVLVEGFSLKVLLVFKNIFVDH